jgi:hypothetical protein
MTSRGAARRRRIAMLAGRVVIPSCRFIVLTSRQATQACRLAAQTRRLAVPACRPFVRCADACC